jgi:hypothetical protein
MSEGTDVGTDDGTVEGWPDGSPVGFVASVLTNTAHASPMTSTSRLMIVFMIVFKRQKSQYSSAY